MEELRKKIAARIEAGDQVKEIAERFQVTRKMIHKVKTVYMASGDFSDRKKTGRPRTTRTAANIAAVKAKINKDQRSNIRQMARELDVPKSLVSTIVPKDLSLRSRACTKVQGLTAKQRKKKARTMQEIA